MTILALAGLGLVLVALAYVCGRLHQLLLEVEKERARRLPNWLVAGIEDAQAVSLDTLLRIEAELEFLRARARKQLDILGEVRQGHYDAEKPAAREDGGRKR